MSSSRAKSYLGLGTGRYYGGASLPSVSVPRKDEPPNLESLNRGPTSRGCTLRIVKHLIHVPYQSYMLQIYTDK